MPNESERISFGEFAQRKGLRERIKRAFSSNVIDRCGRLDFRPAAEWEGLLASFLGADRRRKAC